MIIIMISVIFITVVSIDIIIAFLKVLFLFCRKQGWEGYFGNVIDYRLLVTILKM